MGLEELIGRLFDGEEDLFSSKLNMQSPSKKCCVCGKSTSTVKNIADDYYSEHKDEIEAKKIPHKWCVSCAQNWSSANVNLKNRAFSLNY